MSTPALVIEELSKCYQISHQPQIAYHTLCETVSSQIKQGFRHLIGRSQPQPKGQFEELWALKDISFSLPVGSRLGIIGANGAGKSTLLKILSRVIQPTSGRVTIRGRISSLLEIGTGFHLELTGAENIYLNGAILGMSRCEIKAKFDQIVAFSELEQFLDTPLKRYSSGMQMRLAFAVAAHLDPDILIIDEALAVGDFKFQEKCLQKLHEVGHSGRTVIFVSHDINKVFSLCNMGLFLEKGQLTMMSDIRSCVTRYMDSARQGSTTWSGERGNHQFVVLEASLRGNQTAPSRPYFVQGEKICLHICFAVKSTAPDIAIKARVMNAMGITVASQRFDRRDPIYHTCMTAGQHQLVLPVWTYLFYEGQYQLLLQFTSECGQRSLCEDLVLPFQILQGSDASVSHSQNAGVLLGQSWMTTLR